MSATIREPGPDTDSAPRAALASLFAAHAYRPIEPPILQPVDVFLDLSGEDIRRRLFVTQDARGTELCLRPEYTIPVCLAYLAGAEAGRTAAFGYAGPVFRHRGDETGEFPQAGFESFGRTDRTAAEAEILTLALEACRLFGLQAPLVRMGDLAITHRLLDLLSVPPAARRRFLRALVKGEGQAALDAQMPADTTSDYAGLLATLEGQDPRAAKALVEDMLAIAGIAQVGGRTASEIAARFLDKARQRDAGFSAEARPILARYLAIQGPPPASARQLRALATETGLDLGAVIDAFEKRIEMVAKAGIDVSRFAFAGGFARNLDYYTGFVFEIADPDRRDGKPVGGGGRYDELLSRLGATTLIPAVGCSLWLDRLGGEASR